MPSPDGPVLDLRGRVMLVVRVAGIVAGVEAAIMAVLPFLHLPTAVETWADPALLTAVGSPLVYWRVMRPLARQLETLHETQSRQGAQRGFDAALHQAFDMAFSEAAAVEVASHVLSHLVPTSTSRLMLADSSEAHLTPVMTRTPVERRPPHASGGRPAERHRAATDPSDHDVDHPSGQAAPSGTAEMSADASPFAGSPPASATESESEAHPDVDMHNGCPVRSPWECPAIVTGRTQLFLDTNAVNACPQLRARQFPVGAAACLPVTSTGRALGVLHVTSTGPAPFTAQTVERLEMLAGQAGSGIGMRRAFNRTQVQAETDSLTGLLNRRTLEDRARLRIAAHARPYAVLMIDLDHFKSLNDVHGHDAGDRAIRTTARLLREATREHDLVGRYGGEEFVIVLPDTTEAAALHVAERIRAGLEHASTTLSTEQITTASIGVATAAHNVQLSDTIRRADRALLNAKRAGRNRVHTPSGAANGTPAQDLPRQITSPDDQAPVRHS